MSFRFTGFSGYIKAIKN